MAPSSCTQPESSDSQLGSSSNTTEAVTKCTNFATHAMSEMISRSSFYGAPIPIAIFYMAIHPHTEAKLVVQDFGVMQYDLLYYIQCHLGHYH